MTPDLVISGPDGRERIRMSCGCLILLIAILFFAVFGFIKFLGM